jgi:hypothetical protein
MNETDPMPSQRASWVKSLGWVAGGVVALLIAFAVAIAAFAAAALGLLVALAALVLRLAPLPKPGPASQGAAPPTGWIAWAGARR